MSNVDLTLSQDKKRCIGIGRKKAYSQVSNKGTCSFNYFETFFTLFANIRACSLNFFDKKF